ncbi:MAG: CotH kinase family protein [Clostridium sp.]|nr:CotH kinase family protein [Clostridium sp.]
MKHIYTTIILSCIMSASAVAGTIVINEIMQSNVNSYMADNNMPDSWVELYNPTDEPVDISGWKIGVKSKASKAYTLPSITPIQPKGYLVVFCDKEETGLHTSFRLESTSAGDVYLFDTSDNLVDHLSHDKMPAPDIAYGRLTDGADQWGYFVTSTPGSANLGNTSSLLLSAPVFSVGGGVFYEPVDVTVGIPESAPADAVLCVTTDGRVPTISDRVDSPCVLTLSESTPLQARLVSDTALSPLPVSNTYLFPDHQITMPIVCMTTDERNLYDEEIGMLYNYMEEDWRRPVNIEIFDGETHQQVINQQGETEIQGWSSRQFAQKSLKLYANKRFGTKRFNHPLWPADKPDMDEFQSFSLRNGGNTFALDHLRDSYYNMLFGTHVGDVIEYQSYRPCVAYINGNPYGMIDLRERANDHYIEATYPDIEDYCMVEDWYDFKTDEQQPFWDFYNLYSDPNSSFAELNEVMDMESFATLFLADAFSFDVDTPDGNIVMWKPAGGKWKWFLKDMDCTNYDYLVDNDYIDYLNMIPNEEYADWFKNTENGTRLFRKCLSFPEFTEILVNRYIAYYGDFLRPSVACTLFDDMKNEIRDEFSRTAELYGFKCWLDGHVEPLKQYVADRGPVMFEQFRTRYDLGDTCRLTIGNPSLSVSLFGHKLNYADFDGLTYTERNLRLDSDTEGVWVIDEYDAAGERSTSKIVGKSCEFAPSATAVRCHVEFADPTAIDDIRDSETVGSDLDAPVSYYTIDGIRLDTNPEIPGLYIEKKGRGQARKIIVR